jgi:hypothetical protein
MELPISLDAIFVPFRDRSAYVNNLLLELIWYEGPIYLMPSAKSDLRDVTWNPSQKVEKLTVHLDFINFFDNLLTSSAGYTQQFFPQWDLPLKRNYALWHSRKKNYNKILLVDDDIRGLCASILSAGSTCLDNYVLAGCFVTEFPDLSIIYHLEQLYSDEIHPLLSGSFLFLRPNDTLSFFPKIYNEDWLFMIPHISSKTICSFGSITQVPYDPFENLRKVAFQEFGDIIAEGLYSLLSTNQFDIRYHTAVWKSFILERRQLLQFLKKKIVDKRYLRILETALEINFALNAGDCIAFVEKWESDLITWQSFC